MKAKVRFLGLDVHAATIGVAVAEPDGSVRSLGTISNRVFGELCSELALLREQHVGQIAVGGQSRFQTVIVVPADGSKVRSIREAFVPLTIQVFAGKPPQSLDLREFIHG